MTMTRPTSEQITHKGQLLSTVLEQAVNVKDFGAVGDGVTDDLSATKDNADGEIVDGFQIKFVPDLDGPNFIAQAYAHFKALPQLAGAINC